MSEKKPPIEFSKILVISAAALNLIVVAYTMVLVAITLDLTPLAYLIPAVAAEVAAGYGFYYNKAKVENRIKLMKLYGVEPSRESFKDSGDSGSDYYGYG